MNPFLKHSATIQLTPSPGWSWAEWDGVLSIESHAKPLLLSNDPIIIASDVPLFTLKLPRSYKADFFSDTPGLIATAVFSVDTPTLASKIKVNGFFPLLMTTTGTFSGAFALPSTKLTPGGPVPDPLVLKTGTWKVVETKQDVFIRNQGCIDSRVAGLTHQQKMEASLHQSNISSAVLAELGGVSGIVTSLAITGGILAVLAVVAMVPGGIVVEAIGAGLLLGGEGLLLAGAALSGIEIGQGIAHLADFYDKSDIATTCQDLKDASKSLEDGIAAVGVGGVNAIMAYAGARKAGSVSEKFTLQNSKSPFIKRPIHDGAYRAAKHGAGWETASLKEHINIVAPNAKPTVLKPGKTQYLNEKTGKAIIHDTNGNYFRIYDTHKNQYLGLDEKLPKNFKIIDGKSQTPRGLMKQLTHFKNTDK